MNIAEGRGEVLCLLFATWRLYCHRYIGRRLTTASASQAAAYVCFGELVEECARKVAVDREIEASRQALGGVSISHQTQLSPPNHLYIPP